MESLSNFLAVFFFLVGLGMSLVLLVSWIIVGIVWIFDGK